MIITAGKLDTVDFDALDLEIEFLQKVIAIEDFFESRLQIPQEISVEDHKIIDYLYSMIKDGAYHKQLDKFQFILSLSDESIKSIAEMEDAI